jgi:hypothetical protein
VAYQPGDPLQGVVALGVQGQRARAGKQSAGAAGEDDLALALGPPTCRTCRT